MTSQQARFTSDASSGLQLYRELVSGRASFAAFIYYELATTLLGGLAGLAGLGLRGAAYPRLLRRCGKRPAFGRGMIVRRPRQISLGNKVILDDYTVLDVRGDDASIDLSDHVCIGRFTTIAAKGGHIMLGAGANVGSYCRIATQSQVSIGASVLVGAYCYIGPGNHQVGDETAPLITREMDIKGGVKIGEHAWLGSHVTVLDGVEIGAGAIIGAHSLVRDNVPPGVIAAGVPARILRPVNGSGAQA